MKRPQNYEELRALAMKEMNLATWELEERAKTMLEFLTYMDGCEEWSPETYESALAVADIEDGDDHASLEFLFEIIENWPSVSLGPGKGGYW